MVGLTDLNNAIERGFVQHVFTLIRLIGLSVVCMRQKTHMNLSMYLYLQIFCSNVKRVLEGTVQYNQVLVRSSNLFLSFSQYALHPLNHLNKMKPHCDHQVKLTTLLTLFCSMSECISSYGNKPNAGSPPLPHRAENESFQTPPRTGPACWALKVQG